MERKVRIITVIVLIAAMIITTMAACGSTSSKETTEAAQQTGTSQAATTEAKEPANVSILFPQDNIPAENNSIILKIKEKTNTNLSIFPVAGKDYESRLNVLIAGGDTPDIFQTLESAKLREFIKNDVVEPLDELLASYGRNILENKRKFMTGGVKVDGKVYGIPSGLQHVPFFAVRQDWLNNLNLQVPTNLDELYNVLKAFTFDDPNKDGKDNTIGFGLSWDKSGYMLSFIFAAFGIPVDQPCYIDGKVVPYFMHPNYPDAVKYINKLYNEGLMDPEFATLSNMQSFEKLWNGIYGSFNFNPAGTTNNWIPRYKEDPKPVFTYTVIKGKDGKGGTTSPVMDNKATCISAASKAKEAAMRVLDYLVTEEGQILTYLGIEGKHFSWKEKGKSFEYLEPYTDLAVHRNDGGLAYYYILSAFNGIEIQLLNETTRKAYELINMNQVEDAHIYEAPQIQLDTGSILRDHYRNSTLSLIVTKGDIDKELQEHIKKFMEIGGDKWIEQATEIYKKERGLN